MSDVTIEEIKEVFTQVNKLNELLCVRAIAEENWWGEKSTEVKMAMCQVLIECIESREYFEDFKAMVMNEMKALMRD